MFTVSLSKNTVLVEELGQSSWSNDDGRS